MNEYKIAVIYGHDDPSKNMKVGEIERRGKMNDETLHVRCLLECAEEKYPEVPIFKRLNARFSPEIVAYFFTQLGDIVFLNVSRPNNKTGILLMPDAAHIEEKQKTALYQLANKDNDFSITILYDLALVDGILDGKTFQSREKISAEEVLDTYFKNQERKSKAK